MTRSRHILPPRQPWVPAEDEILRRAYPHNRTLDIAEALGRTDRAVYERAAKLGLRKSPEFLRSGKAGRLDGVRGARTRFKPGHQTWNKGQRGSTGYHPNSRRTQFKAGEMRGAAQHNYKPIGSLRITKDGYLERKVTDDPNIYPARRWVAVQRLVWEAAHGPIPKGHAVVFKPGQHTTIEAEITLDRIELITRAELMRRNTRHRLPKPLADLVALRGALTRHINKRRHDADEARSTP